jgi:Bacterial extracellular solute-binding proteins, family 5 Middle
VRVHLAHAFAPFVHNLAEPWSAILPREVEDRLGDFRTAESLIGCGPFVLERYEPGVKAVFSRNPTYHAPGLPYLDKVEWLFIKDRATQLALFRAGQVDEEQSRLPAHVLGRARGSLPGHAHRPGALQRRAGAPRAQPGGGPQEMDGRATGPSTWTTSSAWPAISAARACSCRS